VECSIWRGENGHCNKCSCAAVQNEVFDFLSQLHNKLSHLNLDKMDSFSMLFLAGKGQQQTNQPNDQAGSYPN